MLFIFPATCAGCSVVTPVTQHRMLGWSVSKELGRMWKDVVVTQYKILFWCLSQKKTVDAHEDLTTVHVRLESELLQLETNRSTGDKISTYHHVDTACIFGTKIRHVNWMWHHTAIPTIKCSDWLTECRRILALSTFSAICLHKRIPTTSQMH
jgi:hypothetical protein